MSILTNINKVKGIKRMKQQFIKTADADVAKELRSNGYRELNKEGKYFVFLNNGNMKFSEESRKKFVYTDKMFC